MSIVTENGWAPDCARNGDHCSTGLHGTEAVLLLEGSPPSPPQLQVHQVKQSIGSLDLESLRRILNQSDLYLSENIHSDLTPPTCWAAQSLPSVPDSSAWTTMLNCLVIDYPTLCLLLFLPPDNGQFCWAFWCGSKKCDDSTARYQFRIQWLMQLILQHASDNILRSQLTVSQNTPQLLISEHPWVLMAVLRKGNWYFTIPIVLWVSPNE